MADTLKDVEQAIADKEYSTAIIHLKNKLKQNPKNAQARYLLGDVYLQTGKLDSGIKELGRAHKYAPDNTEILFRYTEVLQATGRYEAILETLKNTYLMDMQKESQRLNHMGYAYLGLKQLADAKQSFNESNNLHENIMSYNGLSSLAVIEKDLTQANQLLTKSLALEPDNPNTLQLKAKLTVLNKQYEQALLLYNDLIEKNTNNLTLYLERAGIFLVLKKYKLAKADLKVILNQVKSHPQANFVWAQILLGEHDFTGANDAAQYVVNAVSQHMPAILILGAANFGLKNYNQAIEHLTIYLAANPSDLNAQNMLANVYLAQGKSHQALLILEGISQDQRNSDPMILMTLGNTYIFAGDIQKGINLLIRAQSLAPKNLTIKKHLIAAQFQSGEQDNAISELEQLSNSGQLQARTSYLLIISYIKKDQLEKAKAQINQLQLQTPNDTLLQNFNALVEQLKGNTENAVTQYQDTIKQDNENIPAYMGLARIAALKSDWQESEKYFKQVLRINPKAVKTYLGLAAIAERQNKPQAAEQYFLDAIEQSKDNAQSQLAIAALLSKWYITKKHPEKIITLAKKLKKQHPDNNSVHSFLAKSQILNQQFQQAERTLKSIIAFDKLDIPHRILLAQLISQSPERSDEALSFLNEAQLIAPDNLLIYQNQADVLIKQEKYGDAIRLSKSLQEQFPDSVTGHLIEADIYRAQKQFAKSLPIYQEAYQQKPDKEILSAVINMLLALNQHQKAKDVLTQAINEYPFDIDNLYKLASLYQESRQLDKAELYYGQILNINPNHIVVLNNLAWIYLERNIKQALELAERAYDQAPESASIMDTYGYFLVRDGQYQQGLKLLKQATEIAPQDNEFQYHLAFAYEKTGQRSKALRILESIINSKTSNNEQEKAKKLYQDIKQLSTKL